MKLRGDALRTLAARRTDLVASRWSFADLFQQCLPYPGAVANLHGRAMIAMAVQQAVTPELFGSGAVRHRRATGPPDHGRAPR